MTNKPSEIYELGRKEMHNETLSKSGRHGTQSMLTLPHSSRDMPAYKSPNRSGSIQRTHKTIDISQSTSILIDSLRKE